MAQGASYVQTKGRVGMAEWVRMCALAEAPATGEVKQMEARGVALCVLNAGGRLAALDNQCPHRGGPLGQGWMEGNAVVCPIHAWSFDMNSGDALPPDCGHVHVFPLRVEEGGVLVDLT